MTCNPSHPVLKLKVLVVARKRYLTCRLQTGADTWKCKRWWGPKGPAMGGQNCTEHEESIALSHGTFLLSLSLCNPSSSSRILLISFPESCFSCPRKQPRAAHRYSHTHVSPHFTGLTGSALHYMYESKQREAQGARKGQGLRRDLQLNISIDTFDTHLRIPVWNSAMGSRPVILLALQKFLTSAVIKWCFSTS